MNQPQAHCTTFTAYFHFCSLFFFTDHLKKPTKYGVMFVLWVHLIMPWFLCSAMIIMNKKQKRLLFCLKGKIA